MAEWAEDLHWAWIDVTGKLAVNPRTREWCKLRYPGYEDGCPFYGKRSERPPAAPLINEFMDLSKPHYFVIRAFNLEAFADRMLKKHLGWTPKKARCSRYWQGHVRSLLKENIQTVIQDGQVFTLYPEAHGVNVFRTCRRIGIPIVPRPRSTVYKIAIIGYPPENDSSQVYRESDSCGVPFQESPQTFLDDFLQGGERTG